MWIENNGMLFDASKAMFIQYTRNPFVTYGIDLVFGIGEFDYRVLCFETKQECQEMFNKIKRELCGKNKSTLRMFINKMKSLGINYIRKIGKY